MSEADESTVIEEISTNLEPVFMPKVAKWKKMQKVDHSNKLITVAVACLEVVIQ